MPFRLALVLVNAVLLAAGLLVFLPEGAERWRLRDARRAVERYGRFALAALAIVPVHLVVVQIDAALTGWLGWDFAPALATLEGGIVPAMRALWTPVASGAFAAVYVVLHPFMLYFAPLLFIVSEDERAAKAALLMFPLAYAMAAPFYLFAPVRNVFTYYDISTPVAETFPTLWAAYTNLTTVNNSIPAIHVALALLVANATRYSRNVRFRYFAFAYAGAVVVASLYLAVQWVTAVLVGAALAGFVATLTSRILSVERLALQRVKPEPEEAQAIATSADDIVKEVERVARHLGDADGKPMLVGSVAKDTYLAHSVDFDVFVLYPPTLPREELERRGLAIGRHMFPDGEERYAEHPYVRGRWRVWDADVVPAYEVADASQRLSAVDRTPFHTRLVTGRMTREQRDETRLLKQFMTGVGVYGAEAKTRGFSGYLCELLVLKYGSFRGVLRAGARWKPRTFLALDAIEGNPKFADPLVFIDPVDPKRNVASAVSAETLAQFSDACRAYLHRESLSFFFPRQFLPLPPEDLERMVRRRRGEVLLVQFPKPDVLEDHLHDQLRKAGNAIASLLERHGFEVKRWTTEARREDARVLVEVARLRLPEGVVHAGPPVKEKDHAERFRKTWADNAEALSDVFEEDGRLKVKRRREYRRAEDLVRGKLSTVDLGKHLNASIRRGFTVESGLEAVREDTAAVVTRHLSRKKPWEI